ncbi:MAG: NAD(P)H-hydrate dehydratase, partial [Bacteroidota bacterium]
GEWYIVDIGLHSAYIDQVESDYSFTETTDVCHLLPKRNRFDHKGKAGKLYLVAGSRGKMGAAVLCARAAMKAGVGLLTVRVPMAGTQVVQTCIPEAMVDEDTRKYELSSMPLNDTMGIGPGIGTAPVTGDALEKLVRKAKAPLVLDADALNILASRTHLLEELPKGSILTPHPGEFERLVGTCDDDYQKLEELKDFCKKYGVNMVLKGAYSAVCNMEGKVRFNATGNPGMATGGSGDVLTGIVASLLAQGLQPSDALVLGVFVHGFSADLAIHDQHINSLIASDVVACISEAFKHIEQL